MRALTGFILAMALLLCGASSSLAANARGWVEEGCTFATFHINSKALPTGQELVFGLHTELIPLAALPLGAYSRPYRADESLTVKGQRCSRSGSCEDGTQAVIWLDAIKGNAKRVLGRYSVNFGSQHFEGRFVVKSRAIKPPPICE